MCVCVLTNFRCIPNSDEGSGKCCILYRIPGHSHHMDTIAHTVGFIVRNIVNKKTSKAMPLFVSTCQGGGASTSTITYQSGWIG